jgi:hypothetical protein
MKDDYLFGEFEMIGTFNPEIKDKDHLTVIKNILKKEKKIKNSSKKDKLIINEIIDNELENKPKSYSNAREMNFYSERYRSGNFSIFCCSLISVIAGCFYVS